MPAWGSYVLWRTLAQVLDSRNYPQAGPVARMIKVWVQAGRLEGFLGCILQSPELKIFLEVSYLEILPQNPREDSGLAEGGERLLTGLHYQAVP